VAPGLKDTKGTPGAGTPPETATAKGDASWRRGGVWAQEGLPGPHREGSRKGRCAPNGVPQNKGPAAGAPESGPRALEAAAEAVRRGPTGRTGG